MAEGLSTPFSEHTIANGSSPDDELRLEAARKRLKIERTTSESESPLDVQIRRMTKELEELKKQRQVAELQEQIWTEQQLLEASRNRLRVAAAAASPASSPAPPMVTPALTPASATLTATSTALVPSSRAVSLPPQALQPDAKPPVAHNSIPITPSPSVRPPSVAPQPVAPQQPQTPRAPAQSLDVKSQDSPLNATRERGTTPVQAQTLASPAGNSVANSTLRRPSTVSTPVPVVPKQQQIQPQQPWFDRPCTPGAPADSTLKQLPPYQGQTREEYGNFIAAHEAHFAKAPQYFTTDREYRKVKLALQHLAPGPRESWDALSDHPDTWQSLRIFLFKVVVINMKPTDQARLTDNTRPSTSTAQTSAAKQPPPAQSSVVKVPPAQPTQPAKQSPQREGSLSHGPPSPTPNQHCNAADGTLLNCWQKNRETVQGFSNRLRQTNSFRAEFSLHDRMGYLKKGVVPSIRNRAHRPFSYFRTYDEYVVYLQDIEDTLPQRQADIKGEQPPRMTGPRWDATSNRQTTQPPPSAPGGHSPARAAKAQSTPMSLASPAVRSQASPTSLSSRPEKGSTSPTVPKSLPPKLSEQVPPEPKIQHTDGRDWWACRYFIGNLEAYFKNHPQYFTTDERKVAVGRRYIDPSLRGKWNAYAGKHQQMTWFDFCVFIINQSAQSYSPDDAVSRYIRSSQKPHQKIRDFALWVQQWAPHYQRRGYNELRHLYDRALPIIRNRARKDYHDFTALAPFVAYLEAVESTHPDIPKDSFTDDKLPMVPRKRSRED